MSTTVACPSCGIVQNVNGRKKFTCSNCGLISSIDAGEMKFFMIMEEEESGQGRKNKYINIPPKNICININGADNNAINLVEIKCPNCGAAMQINPNLEEVNCNFCGTKMINSNTRVVHLNENVVVRDETEIERLKYNKDLEMKKIESSNESEDNLISLVLAIVIMVLVGFFIYKVL